MNSEQARQGRRGSWQRMGVVGVPALVALGLYWPVLKLPLIYDTLLHIRITSELNWGTVWWPTPSFGFYRPMTFVPLLFVQDLFGGYPAWLLQGMNWLQHGANVALLAGLLLRLRPRRPRLALFAGLLMAVFPFSYQALAVYGHNVHPAIVGLFLVGLHLYVRARGGFLGTQGNSGEWSEQLAVNSEQSLNHSVSQSLSLQSPVSRLSTWLPTFFVFILALLTHESAVLFGALAGLVEGAAGGWPLAVSGWRLAAGAKTQHAIRNTFPLIVFVRYAVRSPWFVFLVLGGVYFGLYQFLPISRAPQGVDVAAASLTLRLLYVTQAAAYPLTWFAQWWPSQGMGVLLVSAAATLLLTLNALRYPAHRLPLLLGWGWFGLAVLVIAIPLPTDYLLHGPRLLYLSSVGLAVVWAVLLEGTQRNSGELGGTQSAVNSKQLSVTSNQSLSLSISQSLSLSVSRLQPPASLLFFAFILLTNIAFVRGRLADYGRLTGGVRVVAETMADKPADVRITLVNLPQWLGQPTATYPVGAELAQMLGGYLFAEELMAHNLGVDHPTLAVVVPELLQPTSYPYAVHDQHPLGQLDELPLAQQQHFFLTRYLEDGPVLSHVGWVQEADAAARPIASFTVYDLLSAQAQNCDDTVQVSLVWQARGEIPATTSVFVQLLDPAGVLLAQADGPPLSLPPEMEFWRGRELHDIRSLTVEPGQQPGQILVGVYDYLTAARYPATSAEGQSLPDNAFVVPLTLCTP